MHRSRAHVALSLIPSDDARTPIASTIVLLLEALSSINAKICSYNQYYKLRESFEIVVPVFQAHIALVFPIQPLPYFHLNALQRAP